MSHRSLNPASVPSSPHPIPARRHTLPPPNTQKTISSNTNSSSDLSTLPKPPPPPASTIALLPLPPLALLSATLLTASWIGAVLAAHLMQTRANLSRPPLPQLPAISDVSRFPDAHPLFIFGLSLAGFFISQLSLFLRLSYTPSRPFLASLADFALFSNSVGGLLLTIGSAIFIQTTSHAAFLGIGTVFILFWMLIMGFLLRSFWAHVLKMATLCTVVGFGLTLRAAATEHPVYLPVGEYMVLGGICVYLFALAGYSRAIKVRVQLDIVGRGVQERFVSDRDSIVV